MIKRVRELLRCAIVATNGECGRVHDVYFDDRRWIVRYLAVDAGHWSAGPHVLVPLAAVARIRWPGRRVEVALTREQIRSGPPLDAHRPVERQHEIAPYEYLGFPIHLTADGPAAGASRPADDEHLHSARALIGHAVQALDGEVGYVEDFLMDDASGAVRYLVVDSRRWWTGKRVMLATERVQWVSWMESSVHVDLPRDPIRRAPDYDPARPVDPEYEARLAEYYDHPPMAA